VAKGESPMKREETNIYSREGELNEKKESILSRGEKEIFSWDKKKILTIPYSRHLKQDKRRRKKPQLVAGLEGGGKEGVF